MFREVLQAEFAGRQAYRHTNFCDYYKAHKPTKATERLRNRAQFRRAIGRRGHGRTLRRYCRRWDNLSRDKSRRLCLVDPFGRPSQVTVRICARLHQPKPQPKRSDKSAPKRRTAVALPHHPARTPRSHNSSPPSRSSQCGPPLRTSTRLIRQSHGADLYR